MIIYINIKLSMLINVSKDSMFNVSQVVWPLAHKFMKQDLSLDLFPKKLCLYGNKAHLFSGDGGGMGSRKVVYQYTQWSVP